MSKEIVILPPKEQRLTVFATENGLDPYLQLISDEFDDVVPDVSTSKGRKAIASNAAKVRSYKARMEEAGKELSAEAKSLPKLIDAERKRMKDWCDAKALEIRQPLTDWEEEQERIKQKEEIRIAAEKLKEEIESAHELAELMNDKFIAEKLESERIAEQERIAENERLRVEGEKRAAKAAQDAIDKANSDKEEADRNAIAAQERAKVQAEQAAAQKIIDDNAAKEREINAAEAARKAEVARQEKEIEDQRIKQEKLENNKRHVSKIRKEAKESIMAIGFDEADAKKIVLAVNNGSIANITINY